MDEFTDKQNLFDGEKNIKTVPGDKNLELRIINRKGEQIKVTDLKKAIQDAKNAVDFLEAKVSGQDEIQFPESLLDWKYDLAELEKLQAVQAIKHCQICQTYREGLKPVSGQMACAGCRNKAQSKQLAKAQMSFFDDQPALFRL